MSTIKILLEASNRNWVLKAHMKILPLYPEVFLRCPLPLTIKTRLLFKIKSWRGRESLIFFTDIDKKKNLKSKNTKASSKIGQPDQNCSIRFIMKRLISNSILALYHFMVQKLWYSWSHLSLTTTLWARESKFTDK